MYIKDIHDWNSLDDGLRNAPSLAAFRARYLKMAFLNEDLNSFLGCAVYEKGVRGCQFWVFLEYGLGLSGF